MIQERNYLLKVTLKDIKPEIWRQFVVPDFISLDRLHDVIQIVMGWHDYHLYKFEISNKKYTEEPESKSEGLDAGKYRLMDLVKAKGRRLRYIYDFGDCWEHEIFVEDSRYQSDLQDLASQYFGRPLIECLTGARACPPEDVESVPGYYDFCEAVKNPNHKEHSSMKQWFAGLPYYDNEEYDSEFFDIEKVNSEILKYIRWSRPRRL